MSKKVSMAVLTIFIMAAVFLGLLLLNKGDGPVMGMILADKAMADTETYNDAATIRGDGIYLIVSNAFNKLQEDYKTNIPVNKDLYAAIYFVESPKGSEYTGKWLRDGEVIQSDMGILPTEMEGVISYMLDGSNVSKGSYSFELYHGDRKIFEKAFFAE